MSRFSDSEDERYCLGSNLTCGTLFLKGKMNVDVNIDLS
jgi:hypothetical protein